MVGSWSDYHQIVFILKANQGVFAEILGERFRAILHLVMMSYNSV